MNRRILVIASACGVALGFGLLALRTCERTQSPQDSAAIETSARDATDGRFKQPWEGNSQIQLPPDVSGKYDPNLPQWKEWRRRRAEDEHWESKMPISFFGRVIDLEGRAVQGARVLLQWSNREPPDGVSKTARLTDEKGQFELSGVNGRLLTVKIDKEGYRELRSSNQLSFEYAQFYDPRYYIPNKNSPVLFRLQKQFPVEPLYVVNVTHKEIPPELGQVALNFETGAAILGGAGDLNIKIQRPFTKGEAYDYAVTFEGGNGWELAPTTEEYPALAPEGGYENRIHLEAKANHPKWRQKVERMFYVRNKRSGRYGVVMLTVDTNNNRITRVSTTQWCGVIAEVRINPSGSRVLEYDPKVRIPKL
jgi:hypothetical protein